MLNDFIFSSLNFIVKEHIVGIIYAGCSAGSLLYIVDTEIKKLGTV